MTAELRFCCPACRGSLAAAGGGYHCRGCGRSYPVHFGIPDFRLAPDPRLPLAEDLRRAERLAAAATRSSFEDLLRLYWEMSPDTPPPAAARYRRFALDGEERGREALSAIEAVGGGHRHGRAVLEIGCGAGGFLAAAQGRFDPLVGVDVALRWLVVARRRVPADGPGTRLVCASADRLPFGDGAFDGVVALHTLEHTAHPAAVLVEAARALRPGGLCYVVTPNRLSLGPEPCVRVLGVGLLPRAVADRYVRLVTGHPYRHIRLLSAAELRRLARAAGFGAVTVSAPRLAACELRALSPRARRLASVYQRLREIRGLAPLCRLGGPLLEAIAVKPAR